MMSVVAAVLALVSAPAQTSAIWPPVAGAPAAIPVAALRGRPLGEVLARLGAVRDPAPAIAIRTAQGRTDIYRIEDLTPPVPHNQVCDVRLVRPEAAEQREDIFGPNTWVGRYPRVAALYAVVRDGTVRGLLNPPRGGGGSMVAGEAPWLSSAAGRLPLSEGDGFLDRRPDLWAPDEALLKRPCQMSPILLPAEAPAAADTGGRMQGSALLPFAWRLPALNAERRQAQIAGSALFAQMRLGEAVPGGAQGFVDAHPGVRLYHDDADPTYAVLVINMGAEADNNLARMNATALVGVRDGRVAWLADGGAAAGLGLSGALCVDDLNRAGAVRPGCSDTGFYSP